MRSSVEWPTCQGNSYLATLTPERVRLTEELAGVFITTPHSHPPTKNMGRQGIVVANLQYRNIITEQVYIW